jgi:hypothetical protein
MAGGTTTVGRLPEQPPKKEAKAVPTAGVAGIEYLSSYLKRTFARPKVKRPPAIPPIPASPAVCAANVTGRV